MTREQGWLMKTRQSETGGLIDAVPAVALVLPASPAAIGEIKNAVGHLLASIDLPAETVQAADIAVSEAVSNAVAHAHSNVETGQIAVHADVEGDGLEVVVSDEGEGIQSGPRAGLGTGLGTIAEFADDFSIDVHESGGLEIWMRFLLPTGERALA